MSPREKNLSDEDRILWTRVAKTAKPLKGRKVALLSEPEPVDMAAALDKTFAPEAGSAAFAAAKPLAREKSRIHPFDAPTRNKLSKGRLPIEGRVDLHGMTQSEAHALLLSFLHRAYAEGMRYVLVITGKGSSFGSDGVLRRAVPQWLATPSFRGLVSSHDSAARHHGGVGAIYIRLRRHGGERG
ncbi:DNA-nicking endonuclease, Smr domain [Mesorhizobium albiziae]|uniref:DNA-nicking endonuclease, Smr domain n=1 Tax=Neomesorhizobium albiziae TaxID=335020 RepID=A0A1I3Y6I3_9HYPH|nr:Smr/MutS family protein [Mesorhizobium albiziae]GLS30079.1 DNA mismatch repair protein MutS [Mesorhizobium albiziae]SFK27009.1 DNA-nicking endonuclease, Smr domain [Mesorhizobium albiziae]